MVKNWKPSKPKLDFREKVQESKNALMLGWKAVTGQIAQDRLSEYLNKLD